MASIDDWKTSIPEMTMENAHNCYCECGERLGDAGFFRCKECGDIHGRCCYDERSNKIHYE